MASISATNSINPTDQTNSSRAAFTLLELILVVSLIALVLAITLPAISSARRAAVRIQCQNRIKQIGLAMHSYESAFSVFPQGHTFQLSLLPHLDESALAESYREIQGSGSLSAIAPGTREMMKFACPAQPSMSVDLPFHLNYFVSGGLYGAYTEDGSQMSFAHHDGYRMRMSRYTDGADQTAVLAERVSQPVSFEEAKSQVDAARVWAAGNWKMDTSIDFTKHPGKFQSACDATPIEAARYSSMQGFVASPLYTIVTYNHAMPPNQKACGNSVDTPLGPFAGYAAQPPSSDHGEGAHVLMASGRVQFVTADVDVKAWQAMGTREEGDLIRDH